MLFQKSIWDEMPLEFLATAMPQPMHLNIKLEHLRTLSHVPPVLLHRLHSKKFWCNWFLEQPCGSSETTLRCLSACMVHWLVCGA